MLLLSISGAAAGLALCWTVPWEAADGIHCTVHQSLQFPPPDTQLHKSGHGRQGAAIDSLLVHVICHKGSYKWYVLSVSSNQMWFLSAPGHESCWDQGPHREWQRTSPAGFVYQVNSLLFCLWICLCHLSLLLAFIRRSCAWHLRFLCSSYVGNVEINVEVKRYFCKAGVKGIQVCTFHVSKN